MVEPFLVTEVARVRFPSLNPNKCALAVVFCGGFGHED